MSDLNSYIQDVIGQSAQGRMATAPTTPANQMQPTLAPMSQQPQTPLQQVAAMKQNIQAPSIAPSNDPYQPSTASSPDATPSGSPAATYDPNQTGGFDPGASGASS